MNQFKVTPSKPEVAGERTMRTVILPKRPIFGGKVRDARIRFVFQLIGAAITSYCFKKKGEESNPKRESSLPAEEVRDTLGRRGGRRKRPAEGGL